MAEKVDRRVRKTKAQLRQGLARLMQKKSIKEITVKELVDEVDINRSTFYLHYTDIYQMLEKIEEEAMLEIREALEGCPFTALNEKRAFPSWLVFSPSWTATVILLWPFWDQMATWILSQESRH